MTNLYVTLSGAVTLVVAVLLMAGSSINPILALGICLLATAVPVIFGDLVFLKVHRRPSTGLQFAVAGKRPANYRRIGEKLLGLYVTLALIILVYWVLPLYHTPFYEFFVSITVRALPFVMLVSIPYFVLVDRHMVEPSDGYWHMGRLVLGKYRGVDWSLLREYWLGWIIKAFFLAFMLSIFPGYVIWLVNIPLAVAFSSFSESFSWFTNLFFLLDVSFGAIGYILTLRILDSHIRSPNPLLLGWLVALICYPPFNFMANTQLLKYNDGVKWTDWLEGYPVLMVAWGGVILFLTAVYASATVIFGVRFSNLTHRGIITNGPYRFSKHPAYISKNIFWWMISMPFLSQEGWDEAARHCILLVAVNIIYYLRARTEERHLSEDPVYVEYALWIERHGILNWIGRAIPSLRYTPPLASASAAADRPPAMRPEIRPD